LAQGVDIFPVNLIFSVIFHS